MKNTLIPAAIVLLALSACRETPEETAEDVAEARADGAEEVREAEADRLDAQRDAVGANANSGSNAGPVMGTYDPEEDNADADYDVAVAKAQSTLDVEQEKCEAMTGDARDNCKDAAKAVYDQAVADAELRRTREMQQATPAEGALEQTDGDDPDGR
jgi:hypothetical protein